jgi:integrase
MAGSIRSYQTKKEGKMWLYELEIGKDENGKRKKKKKLGFKTKKEAKESLVKAEVEMQEGMYIKQEKSFGEVLDFWLENYARQNTKPKTYSGYESMIRNHIKPKLGRKKIKELTPADLQKYYNFKLINPIPPKNKPLSSQSVKHHHKLISKVLNDAVCWQFVSRNVADGAKAPSPQKVEMKTYDAHEIDLLLKAAEKSTMYYPLIATAVLTGMRRSELLGLRWKDVDFENKKLYVIQTITEVNGKYHFNTTTKNGVGRSITMTKSLYELLKKNKADFNVIKLQLGQAYNPHDLVFCNSNGNIITPSELTRHYKRAIKIAGLPDIRFHDLRHSHATIMLKQNVNAKIVSERLGHSTIGITLDTYSHVLPDMQKEAADQLEKVIKLS